VTRGEAWWYTLSRSEGAEPLEAAAQRGPFDGLEIAFTAARREIEVLEQTVREPTSRPRHDSAAPLA
jgi:hypothetical protein